MIIQALSLPYLIARWTRSQPCNPPPLRPARSVAAPLRWHCMAC